VDVGSVTVTNLNNGSWEVTYQTTGDWVILQTHFEAGCALADFPQKKGNAVPGQFDYDTVHDNADQIQTLTFTVTDPGCGAGLATYFAAHAVVMDLSDAETPTATESMTLAARVAWAAGLGFPAATCLPTFRVSRADRSTDEDRRQP
jgi:hypothetical protein